MLSGGDIPALPHPFLVHATFTITNGQITHAVIITDAQTRQDMQAVLGPPPGTPSDGQTSTPVQVVLALADAQNQNDAAAMRPLLSPDASIVNDPMFGGVENREQFIADNTGANNSYVAASNVQQTAPDTVTADAVLSGGQIPAQLPHPFLVHVVFKVVNGQVTHAEEMSTHRPARIWKPWARRQACPRQDSLASGLCRVCWLWPPSAWQLPA